MPTDVLIVNLAVLVAVLWADLGTKKITPRRVLRPLIIAAVAVAVFMKNLQTSGNGLAIELAGLAGGLILGAIGSHLLMHITRDPETDEQVSVAGTGYAAFWIIAIGARLIFTYGANHWYTQALGHWMTINHITVNGLTDALVLFAIGMVLARLRRFAHALQEMRTLRIGPNTNTPALAHRIRLHHRATRP